MTSHRVATAALGLLVAAAWAPARPLGAQEASPPDAAPADTSARAGDPLHGFARLIGTWASGATRQTFEWGVGRLVVRARSSVAEGDAERLVSEGMFLHDPLRNDVRGYFAAIEMPASYFEYSVRWEDDALIAHLTTTEPDGSARRYVERWQLVSPDRIAWSLRAGEDEAGPVVATAEFVRTHEAAAEDDADGGEGP